MTHKVRYHKQNLSSVSPKNNTTFSPDICVTFQFTKNRELLQYEYIIVENKMLSMYYLSGIEDKRLFHHCKLISVMFLLVFLYINCTLL